jgi:hypothetical protein
MTHMVDAVQHRITRKRSWQAWAGTIDELKRVGQIAQDIFRERQHQIAIEQYSHLDDGVERLDSDERLTFEQKYERRKREELLSADRFQAVLENGPDTASGGLEDVLAEFDQRTVTVVKFEGTVYDDSVGREHLAVVFSWQKPLTPAVVLNVTSADHGWANKARAVLSEELDKRKLWWANVHKPIWHLLLTIAAFLVVELSVVLIIHRFVDNAATRYIVSFAIAALVVYPVMLSNKIFTKMFPRCEILDSSGSSTAGTKRLVALLSAVGSILIGVLVNLIS